MLLYLYSSNSVFIGTEGSASARSQHLYFCVPLSMRTQSISMFLGLYLAFKYCHAISAPFILVIESTSIWTSLYLCFTLAIIHIHNLAPILRSWALFWWQTWLHTPTPSLLLLKFKGNSFYSIGLRNKSFLVISILLCTLALLSSLSLYLFHSSTPCSFESGSLLCHNHCNCYFGCLSIPYPLHSFGGITSSNTVAVSHFNLCYILLGKPLVPYLLLLFLLLLFLSVQSEVSFHINGKAHVLYPWLIFPVALSLPFPLGIHFKY